MRPEPSPEETFFHLKHTTKSKDELMEFVNTLDRLEDRKMLEVVFKKCKFHDVKIAAGKRLYY